MLLVTTISDDVLVHGDAEQSIGLFSGHKSHRLPSVAVADVCAGAEQTCLVAVSHTLTYVVFSPGLPSLLMKSLLLFQHLLSCCVRSTML